MLRPSGFIAKSLNVRRPPAHTARVSYGPTACCAKRESSTVGVGHHAMLAQAAFSAVEGHGAVNVVHFVAVN